MVAGRDALTVEVDGEALDARVVSFDPNPEQTTLNGPDIYRTTDVTREVYTIATTDGRSL
jgi:hypothetical protein